MHKEHTRESLMADVLHADASMLLAYLRERAALGNLSPITTREALEAIHRRQPDDAIIPQEREHIERVRQAIAKIVGDAGLSE